MEIIHSDLLVGSTSMSTCWRQGSAEGSTGFREELHGGIQTRGVRKGERSESLEKKLKELIAGEFCSSSSS